MAAFLMVILKELGFCFRIKTKILFGFPLSRE